ncbi:MAG TPA: hypothetical protein VFI22_09700 [Thermomicrobiales bacterium]|nr:hypothetical protein [Thermomicrobiales bacterium]
MPRAISITRRATLLLALAAAALFLALSAAFGNGLLGGPLWSGSRWIDSPAITWLLAGLILAAGAVQAGRLPAGGLDLRFPRDEATPGQAEEPLVAKLLFGNVFCALPAMPLRFFAGRMWLDAAFGKMTKPGWTDGGQALHGFWQTSIAVNDRGQGKITYDWYRALLRFMDGQHWYAWFAKAIIGGEAMVGLALLFGGLVGIAAVGGAFMNFNYGLAGSASANPIMLALGVLLVLGWRTAGYWGLDRWLLPALGTPWRPGSAFAGKPYPAGAAVDGLTAPPAADRMRRRPPRPAALTRGRRISPARR